MPSRNGSTRLPVSTHTRQLMVHPGHSVMWGARHRSFGKGAI